MKFGVSEKSTKNRGLQGVWRFWRFLTFFDVFSRFFTFFAESTTLSPRGPKFHLLYEFYTTSNNSIAICTHIASTSQHTSQNPCPKRSTNLRSCKTLFRIPFYTHKPNLWISDSQRVISLYTQTQRPVSGV